MTSGIGAGSGSSIAPWLDFGSGPETDPPNDIFFGADPVHTPARERYALADATRGLYRPRKLPGSNIGKVVVPDTCPECGGLDAERAATAAGGPEREMDEAGPVEIVSDPMGDSDLIVRNCVRCMRATGREKGRFVGAISDADEKRPGRMAAKITGRPDSKLNAYVKPKESTDSIVKDVQKNGTAKFRAKGKADEPKPKPPTMRQKLDGGMADVLRAGEVKA